MADSRISVDQLAALLEGTGEAHHAAYEATDGTDPEWAMWYSGHLQTLLGNGLGRAITRGEIVYLLLSAQAQQEVDGSDGPWPTYYARLMLESARRGFP
jgi:NAD(P)H-hydrate epimerase